MKVTPVKTKLFREGDSLPDFVRAHIRSLKEGSIVVVSSKIVSLSEKRTAPHTGKSKKPRLTLTDGIMMPNAGIDESNGNGKLVLLPKDSYSSASSLRRTLRAHYKIKKLGVVVVDSVILPLRRGVVGVALGYAGFKGVKEYKGKKDLFGRKFKFASANSADSLATAGMITMGEGSERQPLAVIEKAPVVFTGKKIPRSEIAMPYTDDLYASLLKRI